MVDTNTYKLLHPTNADHEAHQELDPAAMDNDDPPADPFPLLLPAKIRGYGFHDKKWSEWFIAAKTYVYTDFCIGELLVRQISDIEWNSTAFESKLVLDTDKKDLIEALVANHSERRLTMKSDFLAGKGEGLLILLHGGPGTGKTLTAETVAELAMKPLYRVTCGDIGTKPEAVESYLESVLFIGSRWNCVVLLDEADVFLEERSKLDLERNALVSVFLRVLEYYDGILILTSNRIGTFDEAFKSRVQLSLHYPPLTAGNRLKVWENFITLLEEEDKTLDYTDIRSSLTSLAQHKLNGRQIRNTLNTARQLAQFKDEKLRYRHIEQAIRNVVDFENYITRLHDGESDEERAEAAGIRHNKKRKIEDCSR
jgi:SpoVK/Ycf46/Vps4 family AAA+-type ATPase